MLEYHRAALVMHLRDAPRALPQRDVMIVSIELSLSIPQDMHLWAAHSVHLRDAWSPVVTDLVSVLSAQFAMLVGYLGSLDYIQGFWGFPDGIDARSLCR